VALDKPPTACIAMFLTFLSTITTCASCCRGFGIGTGLSACGGGLGLGISYGLGGVANCFSFGLGICYGFGRRIV